MTVVYRRRATRRAARRAVRSGGVSDAGSQPPACAVDERRADLLSPVAAVRRPQRRSTSSRSTPPTTASCASRSSSRSRPAAYGAARRPEPGSRSTAGTRIVGITAVVGERRIGLRPARIDVDQGGDYSPYVLTLDAPAARPGQARVRVLVHGELPERRRLPAGFRARRRSSSSRCSTTWPRTTRASAG